MPVVHSVVGAVAGGAGLPAEQLRRLDQRHVPLVGVGEHAPLHAVEGHEGVVHRRRVGGGQARGIALADLGLGDRRVVGGHGVVEQVVVLVDHPVVDAGRVAGVVVDRRRIEGAAAVGVAGDAGAGGLAAVGPVGVAVAGAVVEVVAEAGLDGRVLLVRAGADRLALAQPDHVRLLEAVVHDHLVGRGLGLRDPGLARRAVIPGRPPASSLAGWSRSGRKRPRKVY